MLFFYIISIIAGLVVLGGIGFIVHLGKEMESDEKIVEENNFVYFDHKELK